VRPPAPSLLDRYADVYRIIAPVPAQHVRGLLVAGAVLGHDDEVGVDAQQPGHLPLGRAVRAVGDLGEDVVEVEGLSSPSELAACPLDLPAVATDVTPP
jgi:hypothetical protein